MSQLLSQAQFCRKGYIRLQGTELLPWPVPYKQFCVNSQDPLGTIEPILDVFHQNFIDAAVRKYTRAERAGNSKAIRASREKNVQVQCCYDTQQKIIKTSYSNSLKT